MRLLPPLFGQPYRPPIINPGDTDLPGTPTGLLASAGDKSVFLNWNASSKASTYLIFRSLSSTGTFSQVGSSSSQGYTDPNLTNGTQYFYYVIASNNNGNSPGTSNVASATPFVAAPPPTNPGRPRIVMDVGHDPNQLSASYLNSNASRINAMPFDDIVVINPAITWRQTGFADGRMTPDYNTLVNQLRMPNITKGKWLLIFPGDQIVDIRDAGKRQKIADNFGTLARAMATAGYKAIAFDNEILKDFYSDFVGTQAETINNMQDLGRRVGAAIQANFPTLDFFQMHGPYLGRGTDAVAGRQAVLGTWSPGGSYMNPWQDFFVGMLRERGGHTIDGGELYSIFSDAQFKYSYDWRKNDVANAAFVPSDFKNRYRDTVLASHMVYAAYFKVGEVGKEINPTTFEQQLNSAMNHSDKYAYIFTSGESGELKNYLGGFVDDFWRAISRVHSDGGSPVEPPPGGTVTKNFTPHQNEISNPERGETGGSSIGTHTCYSSFGNNAPKPLPTVPSHIRLLRCVYVLHDFLDSPISQSFLNHISADMARARAQGIKVILHFCYWFNGPQYPGMTDQYQSLQAQALGKTDTDESRILSHIAQLKPILEQNVDVIAWMQAGFMGAWGEGNKSAHGLNYDNSNPAAGVKRIVDALLAALPSSRMVGLRYPPAANTMYGSAVGESEAYTLTPKSRLMLFDDYMGETYPISYNQAQTLWTGQNGEGVPGGYNAGNIGGSRGIDYLAAGHFSAIQPIGNPHLASWGGSSGTIYREIMRRLGYRYELISSGIPGSVTRGGTLPVALRLHNRGFANPINKRRAQVVLRNVASRAVTPLTALNNIQKVFPNPNITKDVTLSVIVPAGLATGNYDVLIALPDESFLNPTGVQIKYSIQLASNDVFESSTGLNNVGSVRLI